MNANVKAGPGDEWFDVVNERDEVVRRELRRVVHAQGLLHRAVHVLVFNAAGRLFLQKRALTKDTSPGLWDSSCSGHVDAGEDYDAAAQRELGEELGLHLAAPPPRWLRLEAGQATGWEFVWVYRTEAEGPFVLHPEEIERGEWIDREVLDARLATCPQDYCSAFREIWTRARRFANGA